jgi:demethylmenaquinone methyltransferase/2-methoxy-6-polyprenyl-1,4-benzoquinol methylase
MAISIDKSDDRVRTMFGQIAPRYDRLNHLLSLGIDRGWRRFTAARLAPFVRQSLLDVCTGTGDLAIEMARRVPTGARVVAADFSADMLALGKDKAQRLHRRHAPIEFVEANALELPFEDNSFDVVSVAFGLRNVSSPDRAIGQMARVSRPSGRVAILEFSMPRQPIVGTAYSWLLKHVVPAVGQWMAPNGCRAYSYLSNTVAAFPAYGELADLMRASGLRHVTYTPLTCGVATLYVGVK